MSFLAQATKPSNKPPMITIVGSAGVGKTTLGASFPAPIFIQAEDGASVFESWDEDEKPTFLPALPKPTKGKTASTKDTLMAQLRELVTAEHDFKTLIVDSITSLNVMLEGEIAQRDGVGNVADASGGFHKGYLEVAQWHADFISACDILRKMRGMSIVFLAHTGIEKVKNSPSETTEYAVYGIDMHKKAASLYVSQSDAVLYVKKEEFITGGATDKKGNTTKAGRVMQTGDRKIITSGDGLVGYVSAKNRYNMPSEIDLEAGENPILQYIKFFN
ncbi:MAG TPA: ATP-binding protein [Aquirhabdus sp.]